MEGKKEDEERCRKNEENGHERRRGEGREEFFNMKEDTIVVLLWKFNQLAWVALMRRMLGGE